MIFRGITGFSLNLLIWLNMGELCKEFGWVVCAKDIGQCLNETFVMVRNNSSYAESLSRYEDRFEAIEEREIHGFIRWSNESG